MIFRFFSHLVFLSIFLFGSTFSCTAFAEKTIEHKHEQIITHIHTIDDCCPRDGHKKQIENKSIAQVLQKQSYKFSDTFSEYGTGSYPQEKVKSIIILHHIDPICDGESSFFIDTIRLLS